MRKTVMLEDPLVEVTQAFLPVGLFINHRQEFLCHSLNFNLNP